MLDGRAGQINQVRRHQGQHARRQKADEAGNQRRGNRDIVSHAMVEPCWPGPALRSEPCPVELSRRFPGTTASESARSRWNRDDITEFPLRCLGACLAHLLLEVSPKGS